MNDPPVILPSDTFLGMQTGNVLHREQKKPFRMSSFYFTPPDNVLDICFLLTPSTTLYLCIIS